MPFKARPISTNILTASAIFLVCFLNSILVFSQTTPDSVSHDKTIVFTRDTTIVISSDSSIAFSADSSAADTLQTSSDELKSKVHYTADDSIRFDITNEKVYLFGNAKVTYEDIELTAAYMEVDWVTRMLYAKAGTDSTGALTGLPVFKQNAEQFTAESITYNFTTKKGRIIQVRTQQGEGYVHGETIKRIDEKNYFIWKGAYTTCDLPHPHYSISSNKLKIIQDNKIITGPAYMVIEDVPTPIAIPFGYFPTRKGRSAGILFPSYGESARLGFFLKDGGYYFGIGDVADFAITGDIYSLGSWGMKLYSNYANRYRFNGNLDVSYSEIKESEKELPDYELNKDFFIHWNHRKDAKANPTQSFTASVNAGTSGYYSNNISSENNYTSNTFQSSITYQKFSPGVYSFTGGIYHHQNTLTHEISLRLPETNFSLDRFYPLKKRVTVGTEKWYEKIGISYTNEFQNSVETLDSLLFFRSTADKYKYGMSHFIPITTSLKVLKYFTLSPSFSYSEKWYMKTINKYYSQQKDSVITETVEGFKAARQFQASVSLNTRVYGMVQFKKGKIAAIRHVLSPTISYGYYPDFSDPRFNSYKSVQYDIGKVERYSIFEQSVYGGPPAGKSGTVTFNLDNNLEMKTRTVTDTAVNLKKIKIFESLAGNVSYNTAADSLKWSLIGINGRTTLFDKIRLDFGGLFDPYIIDTEGIRYNQSELDVNHRLARLVNTTFTVGFNLNHFNKRKESENVPEQELEKINENPENYLDFSIPFNLNINYTFAYSRPKLLEEVIAQTLNFNGDVSLTPKWKITFSSGYDFKAKDVSYTSFGIYRDLHCWEMSINWVPFGQQENYYFKINIKSSILQDLKLTKKNDIYD